MYKWRHCQVFYVFNVCVTHIGEWMKAPLFPTAVVSTRWVYSQCRREVEIVFEYVTWINMMTESVNPSSCWRWEKQLPVFTFCSCCQENEANSFSLHAGWFIYSNRQHSSICLFTFWMFSLIFRAAQSFAPSDSSPKVKPTAHDAPWRFLISTSSRCQRPERPPRLRPPPANFTQKGLPKP